MLRLCASGSHHPPACSWVAFFCAKGAQCCQCKRGGFIWGFRRGETNTCTLTVDPWSGFRPEGERPSLSPELCCSPADTNTTHGRKLYPDTEAVVGHPLLRRAHLEESCLLISEPVKSSSWPLEREVHRELVLKAYLSLLGIDQVEVSCSAKETSAGYFRSEQFLNMARYQSYTNKMLLIQSLSNSKFRCAAGHIYR